MMSNLLTAPRATILYGTLFLTGGEDAKGEYQSESPNFRIKSPITITTTITHHIGNQHSLNIIPS